MHFLKWDKICSPKEMGGLGVMPIKYKNLSMFAKWWWRCYSERSKCWNKILVQKYGGIINFDLSSLDSSRNCSYIVKDFSNLASSSELSHLIDRNYFKWRVNDGSSVYFWEDIWFDQGSLMARFHRLFHISNLKLCNIRNFVSFWNLESINGLPLWNRPLFGRVTSDFDALKDIIPSLSLNSLPDFWYGYRAKGNFPLEIACTS